MKQLASVLSNTRFIVNYEEQELSPEFELIFLTWKPEYTHNENGEVEKKGAFDETRIQFDQKGLNQLIAELKRLNKGANHYNQFAEDINSVVREAKREKGD